MKIPSSGDEDVFVRWMKVPSMADEDAFVKKRFLTPSTDIILLMSGVTRHDTL